MPQLLYTDLDAQGVNTISNLRPPASSGDAATKGYVDSTLEGLAWKAPCRVATVGNIDLSSPGETINAVSMNPQERVLVFLQTTASQNGIYIWNGSAAPMTRALDANTFSELEQAVTTVEEGTNAGSSFRQTAINGTINVSAVTWVSFGVAAPAATETTPGIAEIATQAEVDAGTDIQRVVTPQTLKNWSNAPKQFAATFGDGSSTAFTITHNLGTRDIVAQVFTNSGNYENIICDITRLGLNQVYLIVTPAPAANSLRIVIK